MGSRRAGAKHSQETWDELWRHRKRLYVYRNVVENAETCLGNLENRSILEVGCGRGATLLELQRRGAKVVGLDYSKEALTVCRTLESLSDCSPGADFVNGDARNLPFSSEQFDFVFSVGLLEHFEDPAVLLNEQYRVLRRGGFLLVQVPQKYSLYTALKKVLIRLGKWPYGGWEREFSHKQITALVSTLGLEPRSVYGFGSFGLAVARHLCLPTLDFGMTWKIGTRWRAVRAAKARTSLDICVVAQKGSSEMDDLAFPVTVGAQVKH